MESNTTCIDISTLIDASPLSRFQIWILILVGVSVVIDGFDVQAIGFVAPAIIKEWGIGKAEFGGVFGAGLLGMLIGTLALSVLADKIGRRPVLVGAALFFSLCTLATPWTTSIAQIHVIRFVTGLGLGGIMPNAMALASEYSPKRNRVTLMMLVSCGFTVGAMLGGLLSAAIIPAFGWRAVFYLGALVGLPITFLMYWHVPESLQFLALRGSEPAVIARQCNRIAPGMYIDPNAIYIVREDRQHGVPVKELFRHGRAIVTTLLWVVNFMNLLNLFFLSNWLPTIAASTGLSTKQAVLVGTALQAGGVFGTLLMGPAIDRIGFFRLLVPSFLMAAVAIAAIGQPNIALPWLFVAVLVAGFSIVGGQPAVNALAATYYPTALRSTGIGWSLGIGRIGSIIGPVLGGELILRDWSNAALFLVAAVPAAISALLLLTIAVCGLRSEPSINDAITH